jgi:hypothetical protein
MNTTQILTLAKSYAEKRGLKLSTVSTYATGDGRVFERLSAGRTCTVRRAEKIALWFSDHWPEDLAWPSDIPRPKRAAKRRRAA